MSDPAASTFSGILLIVMIAIAWWRVTLYLAAACLIAVIIFGVFEMLSAVSSQDTSSLERPAHVYEIRTD